jgi:hypothetical protein
VEGYRRRVTTFDSLLCEVVVGAVFGIPLLLHPPRRPAAWLGHYPVVARPGRRLDAAAAVLQGSFSKRSRCAALILGSIHRMRYGRVGRRVLIGIRGPSAPGDQLMAPRCRHWQDGCCGSQPAVPGTASKRREDKGLPCMTADPMQVRIDVMDSLIWDALSTCARGISGKALGVPGK